MDKTHKILMAISLSGIIGIILVTYLNRPKTEQRWPPSNYVSSPITPSDPVVTFYGPILVPAPPEHYSIFESEQSSFVPGCVPAKIDYSEEKLKKLFEIHNRLYFNNELPKDTQIRIAFGEIGDLMGYTDRKANPPIIWINGESEITLNDAEMTELHEEAHLYLHILNPEYDGNHGEVFEKQMLRLAVMGAFNSSW